MPKRYARRQRARLTADLVSGAKSIRN